MFGRFIGMKDVLDRFIGYKEDHLTLLDQCARSVLDVVERYDGGEHYGELPPDAEYDLEAAGRRARMARVFLALGDTRQAWRQLEQAEACLDAAFGVFP